MRTVPLFRFESWTSGADLVVGGVPIEVKTYSAASWPHVGGCISTYQFERVLDKAALVVFCRLPEDGPAETVEIVGAVSTASLAAACVPMLDRSLRANLRVPSSNLQRVWSLAERLSSADDGARADLCTPPGRVPHARGHCSAGHGTFYGHCWGCPAPPQSAPERVCISAKPGGRMHLADRTRLLEAHDGWPFKTGVSWPRLVNVVFDHQPCPFCFQAAPGDAADVDALGLQDTGQHLQPTPTSQ